MRDYVCGLLFSEDGKRVALIEKRRPEWQAGWLNGIGGKVEPNETPMNAMRREFLEESGVSDIEWHPLVLLLGSGFSVAFFKAFDDHISECRTMTDEPVRILDVDEVTRSGTFLMRSLRVMIPLALDRSGITLPITMHEGDGGLDYWGE